MASKTIRVGVIGVGPHFQETLLPAVISQDNVVLSAFCDSSPEARAWISPRFPHAYVAENPEDDRFWKNIDCVMACSWPKIHEYAIERSIKERKHCFCEKPVAQSSRTLARIVRQRVPRELVIRVGHCFRYVKGGAELIDESSRRGLRAMTVSYHGSRPRGSRWGLDPTLSFGLTHLTHALDFVTAAGGKIKCQNTIWAKGKGETVSILCATERCPMISLMATNVLDKFQFSASATFTDGSMAELASLKQLKVINPKDPLSWSLLQKALGTNVDNDGYTGELRDFFGEIEGKATCRLPGLDNALHVLGMIEEIVKAREVH